jgi:hypothetical protein
MRRLILAGATLLPPVPAFYIGGEDLGRFLDHYTLRLLDRLGIPSPGGPEEPSPAAAARSAAPVRSDPSSWRSTWLAPADTTR